MNHKEVLEARKLALKAMAELKTRLSAAKNTGDRARIVAMVEELREVRAELHACSCEMKDQALADEMFDDIEDVEDMPSDEFDADEIVNDALMMANASLRASEGEDEVEDDEEIEEGEPEEEEEADEEEEEEEEEEEDEATEDADEEIEVDEDEEDEDVEILSDEELAELEAEGLIEASVKPAQRRSVEARLSAVKRRFVALAANVDEMLGDEDLPDFEEDEELEMLNDDEMVDLLASMTAEERADFRTNQLALSAKKMSKSDFAKMKKKAAKNRKLRKFRSATKKSAKGKPASVLLPGGKRKKVKKKFFFSTYDAKGNFLGSYWLTGQKPNKTTTEAYQEKFSIKHPAELPKVDPDKKWGEARKKKAAAKAKKK